MAMTCISHKFRGTSTYILRCFINPDYQRLRYNVDEPHTCMTQIQVKCTLCKILSVLSSSYSALPVVSGFCAFDKLRYVYGRQS